MRLFLLTLLSEQQTFKDTTKALLLYTHVWLAIHLLVQLHFPSTKSINQRCWVKVRLGSWNRSFSSEEHQQQQRGEHFLGIAAPAGSSSFSLGLRKKDDIYSLITWTQWRRRANTSTTHTSHTRDWAPHTSTACVHILQKKSEKHFGGCKSNLKSSNYRLILCNG